MGDYGSLFQYEMNIDDIMRRYNSIYVEQQARIYSEGHERLRQLIEMLPPESRTVSTNWALTNILGIDESGSMNETEPTTKVKFLNKKK